MSTSKSNDLARPWSETTFDITNDPKKIAKAREIIENYYNYLDTSFILLKYIKKFI